VPGIVKEKDPYATRHELDAKEKLYEKLKLQQAAKKNIDGLGGVIDY